MLVVVVDLRKLCCVDNCVVLVVVVDTPRSGLRLSSFLKIEFCFNFISKILL